MDKIIEPLLTMAAAGATADEVTWLLSHERTAGLRDLMQRCAGRCSEHERRVPVVGADGIKRREVGASSRRIETPVGEAEVERMLDQASGVEELAQPDAALGLVDDKYTHEPRRIVAEESAKSSFDEVVEPIDKRTGGSVPKRQVEELTVRAAQDFEAFHPKRAREPERTDNLQAAEAEPKSRLRLAKGREPNRTRMAQVAAACSVARWPRSAADVLHSQRRHRETLRPRLMNKRVWASAQRAAQEVVDDVFAEAPGRDPDRRRRWVVLVDGQGDQIKRVERAARVEHQAVKTRSSRSGGTIATSIPLMLQEPRARRDGQKAGREGRHLPRQAHAPLALRPRASGRPADPHRRDRGGVPLPRARFGWPGPARAGRSPAPRRSYGCEHFAPAVTSMPTGSFISRRNKDARTAHVMPTVRSSARFRRLACT